MRILSPPPGSLLPFGATGIASLTDPSGLSAPDSVALMHCHLMISSMRVDGAVRMDLLEELRNSFPALTILFLSNDPRRLDVRPLFTCPTAYQCFARRSPPRSCRRRCGDSCRSSGLGPFWRGPASKRPQPLMTSTRPPSSAMRQRTSSGRPTVRRSAIEAPVAHRARSALKARWCSSTSSTAEERLPPSEVAGR